MITEGYCPTLNIKSDRLAENSMKVYVVYCYYSEFDEVSVKGVFSTRQKAEQWVAEMEVEDLVEIDEYELDNPES